MTTILTIATRESPLALWQANWVKTQLENNHPGLTVKLLGLTTSADKLLDIPLNKVGGKGLFVKELEEALLEKRADIAVHSMKDVPMELPDGLSIPVMCEREDPRDVFVSDEYATLSTLPTGAIVGTSSLRRQSQLAALRSDLTWVPLRGNVNTRLGRLDQGQYNAIILAAAGLRRLGLDARIRDFFSPTDCLPAAGQGVLGVECRADDTETAALIASLNHPRSFALVTAERAMCRLIGGGCQAPVAAFADMKRDQIFLRGMVGQPDGLVILRAEFSASFEKAEFIGQQVAESLLKQGADAILSDLGK